MILFYFFATILIFLGYTSLRSGINYLNYFKIELSKPKSEFRPFATVFVPCRGLDQNLHENLLALTHQDYPNYELVFIVDDKNDESIAVINALIIAVANAENDCPVTNLNFDSKISAKLVIAGKATDEGQKVHNLRQAVIEVSKRSEVFAFVDSDARTNSEWLRSLVAPLADENIGCSTGYRWFISRKHQFSSQLRSAWNASIASALGANMKSNFCWGGSMAIRRETFEKLDIREKWRGTLSDDFAMTRAMKESGLPINFVPSCLTATVEECSFRELLEFTTRQMKITRAYARNLWVASLIGSGIFTITFWSGVSLLFFISGWHFWLTLSMLTTMFALGSLKSVIRLKAVKLVLKEYGHELAGSAIWQITLWVISSALYFYNSLCALTSNVITWRGIRYELESPKTTKILDSVL
jgi:ceramide glucosyltransferase